MKLIAKLFGAFGFGLVAIVVGLVAYVVTAGAAMSLTAMLMIVIIMGLLGASVGWCRVK